MPRGRVFNTLFLLIVIAPGRIEFTIRIKMNERRKSAPLPMAWFVLPRLLFMPAIAAMSIAVKRERQQRDYNARCPTRPGALVAGNTKLSHASGTTFVVVPAAK